MLTEYLRAAISHSQYKQLEDGAMKIRIPNPHGTGEVGAALISEILRQAGISDEDWDKA